MPDSSKQQASLDEMASFGWMLKELAQSKGGPRGVEARLVLSLGDNIKSVGDAKRKLIAGLRANRISLQDGKDMRDRIDRLTDLFYGPSSGPINCEISSDWTRIGEGCHMRKTHINQRS